MNVRTMTPEQIREAGLRALERKLGPVGMVRFLQQFESGKSDYTAERRRWLGKPDVRILSAKIRARRKRSLRQNVNGE